MLLQIENLKITQAENPLFENFNLTVNEKDVIGIFAPTGTGKTTLLNYIAGILPDSKGIKINGKIIFEKEKRISYVFQESRLLENLTVLKNLILPLQNIMENEETERKSLNMLEKVDLLNKRNQLTKKLSGGEKQRVSIARAFVYPGDILLLDEPFHSQDEQKRAKLLELTKQIIQNENRGAIIVSHLKSDLDFLCTKIISEKDFINK